MFDIRYLSSEDRRKITDLKDRLPLVTVASEAETIRAKIVEIEARTKSYLDCTLEEASDLKAQLYDKLYKLLGIGKADAAQQFQLLIQEVDNVAQRLAAEQSIKDKQKKPTLPQDHDIRQPKLERPETKPSPGQVGSKSGRSRWTVGTGAKS